MPSIMTGVDRYASPRTHNSTKHKRQEKNCQQQDEDAKPAILWPKANLQSVATTASGEYIVGQARAPENYVLKQ